MSKIRTKFVCQSVVETNTNDGLGYEATFTAVYSGSEENEKFFRYTPAGSVSLLVLNKKYFTAGKEYYFDISEA